tara:strand:+ start:84 stop:1097 length:1014 start_codon:yes stop_codon:yes gene_type:complete
MATKKRAGQKNILKSLATLQQHPRVRTMFAQAIKLYRSGKVRKLGDIVKDEKIIKIVSQFSKKESALYTKILEPIGFPKIQLKDISGKKIVTFVSARRQKIGDTKAAIDKAINIDEEQKKVLKVMNEHIKFLGEESFFQKAHKEAKEQRILTRNETSMNFYMEYAANYGIDFNHLNMLREGGNKRAAMQPAYLGRMFFYRYRPVLPRVSYDFYPLVFVLKQTPEYFEGINFHNMFVEDRALVLANMYSYLNNLKFDKTTKILFNSFSKVVQTNKQFKLAKSSFRRYKYKDISSKLIEVHPFDWEIATMVSTERFYNMLRGRTPSKKIWVDTRIQSRK